MTCVRQKKSYWFYCIGNKGCYMIQWDSNFSCPIDNKKSNHSLNMSSADAMDLEASRFVVWERIKKNSSFSVKT